MNTSLQKLFKEQALWFATGNTEASTVTRHQGSYAISPTGIPQLDLDLPEGGLLHGAAHEVILKQNGLSAKLFTSNLIVRHIETLLSNNCGGEFAKFIVWISKREPPAPFVLLNGFKELEDRFSLQANLLQQCIFLKPTSDEMLARTVDLLLGSPAIAMLIAELPNISFQNERRFAVRTKKHAVFSIFLRDEKALKRKSSFHSRWSLTPLKTEDTLPAFTIRLESKKGIQPVQRHWDIAFDDSKDTYCYVNHSAAHQVHDQELLRLIS